MPEFKLLSHADYKTLTEGWQKIPVDERLNDYFNKTENSQTSPVLGILFPLEVAKFLLSTEGVTKIKARFCIDEKVFSIILFGSDEKGIINSAYYQGEPYYGQNNNDDIDGNVPVWLANEWIYNWRSYARDSQNHITRLKLFETQGGILDGYTYDMSDILHTLFKEDVEPESERLCVHFGLHKHYDPGVTNKEDIVQSFSLVLQKVKQYKPDGPVKTEGAPFYDISSPCPPIC